MYGTCSNVAALTDCVCLVFFIIFYTGSLKIYSPKLYASYFELHTNPIYDLLNISPGCITTNLVNP